MRHFKVEWIMWAVLGLLEFMLGSRIVLKLIAADPGSGFFLFINGLTGVIIAPFGTLMGIPAFEGSVFEMTSLAAMAVYALLFWIIISVNRPLSVQVTTGSQESESNVAE